MKILIPQVKKQSFAAFIFLLFFSLISNLNAQTVDESPAPSCGFDEVHKKALKEDPEYFQKLNQFDALYQQLLTQFSAEEINNLATLDLNMSFVIRNISRAQV
jgi:hypothetical protein